ncbi:hypothetical protein [uncultured Litoreibacter sp.]|uniref:hypothetical protein n=1 Tax=uncultured Litoreibacter sp. TaxID=1392394 RepID=UPI0026138AA3|nr:hypothetical protein [uncultured Litoreibacter sp.]
MRTWLVLSLASLLLAACGETPLAGLGATGPNEPLSEVTVTSDRIVLRGPDGFCIDPQSSDHRPSKAFMVFANCAAIAGDEELPQPFVSAVVTATVLPAGRKQLTIAQSPVALAEFFNSDAGKAVLSASGDAAKVTILDSYSRNDAFVIHAQDTSTPLVEGTSNTYWRGYYNVKNSIVALTVFSTDASPISSSDGLQTLYDFGAALMKGQAPSAAPPTAKSADDVTNTGLLRRLFG